MEICEDNFCVADCAGGGFGLEGIEHVFFEGDVEDGCGSVVFDEVSAEGGFVGGEIAMGWGLVGTIGNCRMESQGKKWE